MTKRKKKIVTGKSELVAIVSDIHFDLHDEPTWRAFCKWHKDVKPDKTVILGDFLDLGMVSRFEPGQDDPLFVVPQIQFFVKEANQLVKECGELIVVEGNHDERYEKFLNNTLPHTLRGAIGLTLKEQVYAQGLDPKIKWVREDTQVRGVRCGPYLLRHGHNQSRGRFGGGKHLAATRIMKTLGQNEVFGHFHRAQLFCQTAQGNTTIAIANPCMTGDHNYSLDPDWQRGFTVLELYGPDNKYATPNLIIMTDGHFAYKGKVYDGTS